MKAWRRMEVGVVGLLMGVGLVRGDGAEPAAKAEGVAAYRARELAAARAVGEAILQKENIVALTPEYMELKWHWLRRVADLGLKSAETREACAAVVREYMASVDLLAKRLRARRDGGPPPFQLSLAYVSDAAVLMARMKASEQPVKSLLPDTGAQAAGVVLECERRELKDVNSVLKGLEELSEKQEAWPELLEMRRFWLRQKSRLEISVAEGRAGREEAAGKFLKATKEMQEPFTRKAPEGALVFPTEPQTRMLRAYVAEAEALVAGETAGQRTAAVKEAERREWEAAKAVLAGVDDQMKTQVLTPEFVDMRQRWARRVGFLELKLAESGEDRKKVAEKCVTSAKAFRDMLEGRKTVNADKIAIRIGEAGVAEAETVLARVQAGEAIEEEE